MDQQETIVLTLGSWKTEDILPVNNLPNPFQNSQLPHIRVLFDLPIPLHQDPVNETIFIELSSSSVKEQQSLPDAEPKSLIVNKVCELPKVDLL